MQLRNAGLVRRGKIRITPEWQRLILQGLGVLDADGNPTDRLNVVMAADVARLTTEAFDEERARLLT